MFGQDFKPGMKVEAVGTMTNNKGGVYMSGLAYIDTYLNFRPDHYINGTNTNGDSGNIVSKNADLSVDKNFLGFFTQDKDGAWAFSEETTTTDWFAVFDPWIRNGQTFTQTTIWDWTDPSKIVVTYYIQGVLNDKPVQWRDAYTVTAVEGKALAASYKIGLGTDHACYNVNSLTVVTPVS